MPVAIKLSVLSTDHVRMAERLIDLRYPGHCVACSTTLARGDQAMWSSTDRTVRCVGCSAVPNANADPFAIGPAVDRGEPGRNLRTIAARKRERGGTVGAKSAEAFEKGAQGELAVGAALERVSLSTVLHSRRSGPRSDIDHLVVAPSGVWVVDAKNYAGAVTIPLFGSFTDARINGRSTAKLLAGIACQVELVDTALAEVGVQARGAICVVGARWRTIRPTIRAPKCVMTTRRTLVRLIERAPQTVPTIEQRRKLAHLLAVAFPPA